MESEAKHAGNYKLIQFKSSLISYWVHLTFFLLGAVNFQYYLSEINSFHLVNVAVRVYNVK